LIILIAATAERVKTMSDRKRGEAV